MDDKRFDDLAKRVGSRISRRRAALGVVGGLAGLLGLRATRAEAASLRGSRNSVGDDIDDLLDALVCGNANFLCFKRVSDIAICNHVGRITIKECFSFIPPGCYVDNCGTYRSEADACNKLVPACDGQCHARKRCPGHG